MRKEIDILIDPEPELLYDFKKNEMVFNNPSKEPCMLQIGGLPSIIKEPGSARKIYNRLRRKLWGGLDRHQG